MGSISAFCHLSRIIKYVSKRSIHPFQVLVSCSFRHNPPFMTIDESRNKDHLVDRKHCLLIQYAFHNSAEKQEQHNSCCSPRSSCPCISQIKACNKCKQKVKGMIWLVRCAQPHFTLTHTHAHTCERFMVRVYFEGRERFNSCGCC